MFSSNSIKAFYFFILFLLCFSACRFWNSTDTPPPSPTPFVAQEIPSDIPFSTKEPLTYQAEIVSTSFSNGEKTERKTFTARSDTKYLTIFNHGEKHQVSQLQTGGKTFLIHSDRKVYMENDIGLATTATSGETLNSFLTTEWLNQKTAATYEKQGEENGLTKYMIRMGESTASETLIFVNENFNIPVKQEFYSLNGDQKTLMFSSEVTNLKLQTDENLFEIPADFKKITPREFQDIIWQQRLKKE